MKRLILLVAVLGVLGPAWARRAEAVSPGAPAEGVQFFEAKIRPVLTERCFKCHSTHGDRIKGGLLLESGAGMRKGGDHGPAVVPGDVEGSLLIKAIRYTDHKLQMPPKGQLPPEVVRDFEEWVRMGAPDPRVGGGAGAGAGARDGAAAEVTAANAFTAAERSHWALQPVKDVAVPALPDGRAAGNAIDAFVAKKLAEKNLSLAPAVDKVTLLRRVSLDLTGLPPTPAEVDAFVADASPDAFAKVVDRLLASPHYGERWGRHWLDLARFAESDGFKDDAIRPNSWHYRDYVVTSFNQDKPYDRFIKEQIAGDELWPHSAEARVATAFNRHYPEEWNARNLMQRRQETLNDITDTVGAVFTGLTVGCARCHDHKYDPIRQADYYRLMAFFANTAAADDRPLLPAEQLARYQQRLAEWEEKTKDVRAEMDRIEEPKRKAAVKDYFDKFPPEIQTILNKPKEQRDPYERMMAARAGQYLDPTSWAFVGRPEKIIDQLPGDAKKRWHELKARLDQISTELHPGPLPKAPQMADLGPDAPPTFILHGGNYDQPKEPVQPGFLSILDPLPTKVAPAAGNSSSTGRRAALAELLTSPNNPLTARVMVNRIWHYHFGRGIVATPSDFGVQGSPPSHPELLDWLANQFVRNGWSIKSIHRLILNSRTYQQPSAHRSDAAEADPDNALLWRFPPQRLEAEVIRDNALAVAGLLNPEIGGPSVFPEVPTGVANRGGQWKVSEKESDRNRRSVYVFVRRNNRYPLFECFDAPDTLESCARRNMTTTPLQALTMMNNELVLKWAQAFAGRVVRETGQTADEDARVAHAFRLAFGRRPDAAEAAAVKNWSEQHRTILAQRHSRGEKLAVPEQAGNVNPIDGAVLVDLCHTLLNSNEFVYRQ